MAGSEDRSSGTEGFMSPLSGSDAGDKWVDAEEREDGGSGTAEPSGAAADDAGQVNLAPCSLLHPHGQPATFTDLEQLAGPQDGGDTTEEEEEAGQGQAATSSGGDHCLTDLLSTLHRHLKADPEAVLGEREGVQWQEIEMDAWNAAVAGGSGQAEHGQEDAAAQAPAAATYDDTTPEDLKQLLGSAALMSQSVWGEQPEQQHAPAGRDGVAEAGSEATLEGASAGEVSAAMHFAEKGWQAGLDGWQGQRLAQQTAVPASPSPQEIMAMLRQTTSSAATLLNSPETAGLPPETLRSRAFLLKNLGFLLKNLDFLLKNVDFIIKQRRSFGLRAQKAPEEESMALL